MWSKTVDLTLIESNGVAVYVVFLLVVVVVADVVLVFVVFVFVVILLVVAHNIIFSCSRLMFI